MGDASLLTFGDSMARTYKRLEEKITGVVPVVGMGATVHVGDYVVPCTVVDVGTTDRRAPMVGIQVDAVLRGAEGRDIARDPYGPVMLFTWRVGTQEWRAYKQGWKTGARLELGVRRAKGVEKIDPDVKVVGTRTDVLKDRLSRLQDTTSKK